MATFIDLESFERSHNKDSDSGMATRRRRSSSRSKADALNTRFKQFQIVSPDSGAELTPNGTLFSSTPGSSRSAFIPGKSSSTAASFDCSMRSDVALDVINSTFLADLPLSTPPTGSRKTIIRSKSPCSDTTGSGRKRRHETLQDHEDEMSTCLRSTPAGPARYDSRLQKSRKNLRKILKAKHRLSTEEWQQFQSRHKENCSPVAKTQRARSRSPPKKQPRVSFELEEASETSSSSLSGSDAASSESRAVNFSRYGNSSYLSKAPSSVCFSTRAKPYDRVHSAADRNIKQVDVASKPATARDERVVPSPGFVIDKTPSAPASDQLFTDQLPQRRSSPQCSQSTSSRNSASLKKRYFDAGCAVVPNVPHDILRPNQSLVERQVTSYGPYTPGELRWHINGKPTTMAKRRSQSLKRSTSIRDMYRGHPSVIAASHRVRSPSPQARKPQRVRSVSTKRRQPRALSQPATSSWGQLPTIHVFFRGSSVEARVDRSRTRVRKPTDPRPHPEPQDKVYQEAKQKWIDSCAQRDLQNIRKIFLVTAGIVLDDGVDSNLSRSICDLKLSD